MAHVVANMSMSLDGFIENSRGGVAEVFAWSTGGDVASTMPGDDREVRTSAASVEHLLDTPTVVEGTGVTHLHFRVRRAA